MGWLGFSPPRLSSAGCLFSKCLAFSSLNQQASLDTFSSWWWHQCKKWAEIRKASQVRSSELAQCPFHLIPLAKARLLVKHKVNRWGNALHLFNGRNYKPIWQGAEHREGQANWANNSICGRLWAYNQISCVNKPTRLREGKIISQPTNWTHTYLFMSSTDIYWIPTMGQTLFEAHATMTNKKDKSLAVQGSHSGREDRQQYSPKDPSGISLSAQMSVPPQIPMLITRLRGGGGH